MNDYSRRIYFCYAKDDYVEVQRIALEIEHELDARIDYFKGDNSTQDIEENVFPLIERADVVLLFVSEASKESDFVKKCAKYALNQDKRVLPIEFGKSGRFSTSPEEFKCRAKIVDFKDAEQKIKFLAQLRSAMGLVIDGGDQFGTQIHVISDVAVKISRYGKELCITKAKEDTVIRLVKGFHKLDVACVDNLEEIFSLTYEVLSNDGEQFLEIDFWKDKESLRRKREEEALERRNKQLKEEEEIARNKVLKPILVVFLIVCGIGCIVSYNSVQSSKEYLAKRTFEDLVKERVDEKVSFLQYNSSDQIITYCTNEGVFTETFAGKLPLIKYGTYPMVSYKPMFDSKNLTFSFQKNECGHFTINSGEGLHYRKLQNCFLIGNNNALSSGTQSFSAENCIAFYPSESKSSVCFTEGTVSYDSRIITSYHESGLVPIICSRISASTPEEKDLVRKLGVFSYQTFFDFSKGEPQIMNDIIFNELHVFAKLEDFHKGKCLETVCRLLGAMIHNGLSYSEIKSSYHLNSVENKCLSLDKYHTLVVFNNPNAGSKTQMELCIIDNKTLTCEMLDAGSEVKFESDRISIKHPDTFLLIFDDSKFTYYDYNGKSL